MIRLILCDNNKGCHFCDYYSKKYVIQKYTCTIVHPLSGLYMNQSYIFQWSTYNKTYFEKILIR